MELKDRGDGWVLPGVHTPFSHKEQVSIAKGGRLLAAVLSAPSPDLPPHRLPRSAPSGSLFFFCHFPLFPKKTVKKTARDNVTR